MWIEILLIGRNTLLQVPVFLLYAIATICIFALVGIGAALTYCYRIKGWPRPSDATNCWSYAIPRWLGTGPSEHYLILRISRYMTLPHVFYADSIAGVAVEEFIPDKPQRKFSGLLNSFHHTGWVRRGVGEKDR